MLALAAPEAPAAETAAQKLLREALIALESHRSVSAKIHQEIDLFGQQLIGNGIYRQGPPESRWMLLDLKIKVDENDWTIQQRCDGETYWQCRSVGGERTEVSRVDIARLRNRREAWQAQWGQTSLLGMGGLPKLLVALDQAFEFKTVANATFERQPVYALRGEWRLDRLARWLPDQKDAIVAGQPANLTKLPAPIPDHVFVLLGRDDLFPCRIKYGRDAPNVNGESRTVVAMNFDSVVFDQPVDAGEFKFDPGTTPVADYTETYLNQLEESLPH